MHSVILSLLGYALCAFVALCTASANIVRLGNTGLVDITGHLPADASEIDADPMSVWG